MTIKQDKESSSKLAVPPCHVGPNIKLFSHLWYSSFASFSPKHSKFSSLSSENSSCLVEGEDEDHDEDRKEADQTHTKKRVEDRHDKKIVFDNEICDDSDYYCNSDDKRNYGCCGK